MVSGKLPQARSGQSLGFFTCGTMLKPRLKLWQQSLDIILILRRAFKKMVALGRLTLPLNTHTEAASNVSISFLHGRSQTAESDEEE